MSEIQTQEVEVKNEGTIKPRKWYLALLASISVPGLGQMYNGQLMKGIVILIIFYAFHLVFGLFRIVTTFEGLYVWLGIFVFLFFFMIIDAITVAVHEKHYALKNYNRGKYYITIFVVYLIMGFVFDEGDMLGIDNYRIPTSSNEPTIQIGDHLISDMRAYNNNKPDYGHMVVFETDDDEYLYVYRVIGLPNDTIEIINNVLYINGESRTRVALSEVEKLRNKQIEVIETLPNGHAYRVRLNFDYNHREQNFKRAIVPPDNYFLMGDFRSNARDSRFTGAVSEEKILGRILYSYWGELSRIGIDFTNR